MQLPPSFKVEANEIRNQLLRWRLHNLDRFQPEDINHGSLKTRTKQILQPLAAIVLFPNDELAQHYLNALIAFGLERQRQSQEDAG